jgi:hypothetical protein
MIEVRLRARSGCRTATSWAMILSVEVEQAGGVVGEVEVADTAHRIQPVSTARTVTHTFG